MSHEKALEAAARAYDAEDASHMGEPSPWVSADEDGAFDWKAERVACASVAIAAYLSALIPDEVAGVVRELAERAERRAATEGPFTKENLVEYRAASTLTALAARAEKAERLLDGVDEERRGALDMCIERNKTITRLEAENRDLRAKLETVEAETQERCAKVADEWTVSVLSTANDAEEIEMVANSVALEIAAAIRSPQ